MNYQVHELPVELAEDLNPSPQEPEQDIVVNAAVLSWIKVLESENMQLKGCLRARKGTHSPLNRSSMTIDLCLFIQDSHHIWYLSLFLFLGPADNQLNYLGSKETHHQRIQPMKVKPVDQLFMTLMRLRLNLKMVVVS